MAYVQNGKFRCKTATVNYLDGNGQNLAGYPKTYNFLASFTFNSVTYPVITENQLKTMSDSDYQTRLAAFNGYLEFQNTGLNAAGSVETGFEPHGVSPSCPVGQIIEIADPV